MYRVSIEWKFGRMRNAAGTRAAGDGVFPQLFNVEFCQIFTSVSITLQKHGVHAFYFF